MLVFNAAGRIPEMILGVLCLFIVWFDSDEIEEGAQHEDAVTRGGGSIKQCTRLIARSRKSAVAIITGFDP